MRGRPMYLCSVQTSFSSGRREFIRRRREVVMPSRHVLFMDSMSPLVLWEQEFSQMLAAGRGLEESLRGKGSVHLFIHDLCHGSDLSTVELRSRFAFL